MKRVLIVSPHFPPINAPDMQRVRMSLPYYRQFGWESVVLAVADRRQTGVREPELLSTLPPDVRVERAGAVPSRLAGFFGISNIGIRAWPFLMWRGARLLRREKFDLVFFSNTQFKTFILGPLWRSWFGVPYVLDVQDPWRTDYYERPGSREPPGGWKYQFARLTAWMFEGWVFGRAAAVISVSPNYLEDLNARYPRMRSKPTLVLRFGGSTSDLEEARKLPAPSYAYDRSRPFIHFLYTGAAGPIMPHALTVLFMALRFYKEIFPEKAARLRFHFIGTSYVAPGYGKPSVMPVAARFGVEDQVAEIPHRVGHLESIRLQEDADVLLLPGSSDLAYSPSKIYFYYLTGKPILGLVFRDSVMERLLDELSCAYLVRFAEREYKKHEAYQRLHHFFDLALAGFPAGSLPERDDARFAAHCLASELTRQQCALFDLAVAKKERAP